MLLKNYNLSLINMLKMCSIFSETIFYIKKHRNRGSKRDARFIYHITTGNTWPTVNNSLIHIQSEKKTLKWTSYLLNHLLRQALQAITRRRLFIRLFLSVRTLCLSTLFLFTDSYFQRVYQQFPATVTIPIIFTKILIKLSGQTHGINDCYGL